MEHVPSEHELATANVDLGVVAFHRAELDVCGLLLVLEDRFGGLVEVVHHSFDVLLITVGGVLEEFCFTLVEQRWQEVGSSEKLCSPCKKFSALTFTRVEPCMIPGVVMVCESVMQESR